MQTKKAKALAAFILEAYSFFGKVYNKQINDKKELEKYKRKFTNDIFEEVYTEFEDELRYNIEEYLNIEQVHAYIISYFEKFEDWYPFNEFDDVKIIRQEYETGFLIKLKKNIEKVVDVLSDFCETDRDGNPGDALYDFFDETLNIINGKTITKKDKKEYQFESRFDYNTLKSESNQLNTIAERRELITQRLFDFEQWQIQYDEFVDDFLEGKFYKYTRLYYPKFMELCMNELNRLKQMQDIESAMSKTSSEKKETEENNLLDTYSWEMDSTDLVELVTALHEVKAIKRTDGKNLSLVELTDFFEAIFNKQIKNDKGTRAYISSSITNRKLFLDKLSVAFDAYCKKKEKTEPKNQKTRKTGY